MIRSTFRPTFRPVPLVLLALLAALPLTGCVRRTLTITSEPPGALTYVNDREIGRTPATVDFLYYGEYDVRLVLEGYETLATSGEAKAPWWDMIGVDLIAEMVPGEQHSEVHWHYELSRVDNDPNALRTRANELRERVAEEPPPPPERADPGEEPDEE